MRDYWHLQMNRPDGSGTKPISSKAMLEEPVPVIGTGEWDDRQCRDFKGQPGGLKKGDIVLVREGGIPIALCEVVGDCVENDSLEEKYQHVWYRDVKVLAWNDDDSQPKFPVSRGTLRRLRADRKPQSWHQIHDWYTSIQGNVVGHTTISEDEEGLNRHCRLLKHNGNLILTGAPGTGKTYRAREIAGAMDAEVGFVQFHPSMDYTDFVEGLRPSKGDGASFERCDGVFKRFCARANKNLLDAQKPKGEVSYEEKIDQYIEEKLVDLLDKELQIKSGNKFSLTGFDSEKLYLFIPNNPQRKELTIPRVELVQVLSFEGNLGQLKDIWSGIFKLNHARQRDSYLHIIWQKLKVNRPKRDTKDAKTVERKNFVFIIDEINRGEISKIFGELFYAIDPGYRGEKGRVQTQYQNLVESGDPFEKGFFVPENVYIIGTMNDIDRSVESMDFAMRRRFAFCEVKPENTQADILSKLGNKALEDEATKRMNSLNSAICNEPELGKAYQIGGAYFRKLENYIGEGQAVAFDRLWEYHLEGLLTEYVRGYGNDSILPKLRDAYDLKGSTQSDDQTSGQ